MKNTSNNVQQKRVAMFHAGRCGSTVLGSLLDQHPMINWKSEIFANNQEHYLGLQHDKALYARTILERNLNTCFSNVCGFETKYLRMQHLHPNNIGMSLSAYLHLLRSLDVTKYIVLHRRNYLKRAVSQKIAGQNKVWQSELAANAPTTVNLSINDFSIGNDSLPLLELFRLMDRSFEELKILLNSECHLYLTYEDDIKEGPLHAYAKVYKFLDLQPSPVEIRLKKLNPYSLRETIYNYEEVAALLENSEFAWMLYD